jgi:hypothetical protein
MAWGRSAYFSTESLALPHLVFFVLEFGLEFPAVVLQLPLEFICGFGITGGGGFVDFAFQGDFAFGDFGGVFGIEFGELLLLLGSQFYSGRSFIQSLHREFVGAFHISAANMAVLAERRQYFDKEISIPAWPGIIGSAKARTTSIPFSGL